MKLLLIAALLFCISMFTRCTNVSPTDSVSWEVNYTLPLLNERLTVPMLGLDSIIHDDPARNGDTLFIRMTDTLTRNYSASVFSSDIDNSWHTGSVLLNRLNKIKCMMSQRTDIKYIKLDKTKVDPTESMLTLRDTVKLGCFQMIEFGENSGNLIAKVKNNLESSEIKNIQYRIITEYDTVRFNMINALKVRDSVIISALLKGLKIGQNLIVECQLPGVSEKIDNILSFETDFNGLHFSKAIISDSLVGLKIDYKIRYPLGNKGCNASYVDISNFSMPVIIRNTLPLSMKMTAGINNIWDKDYCSEKNIGSFNDLSETMLDSSFFRGNEIASVTVPAVSGTNSEELSKCNLTIKNARILPDWDNNDSINVIDIVLNARIEYAGKLVEIDNAVNTGIMFRDPAMDISSIFGSYSERKSIRSDPVKAPLLFLAPSADFITKLKNRLLPAKTDVNLQLAFRIPDNTSFEDIDITCSLFDENPDKILDSLRFRMNDIRNGKVFSYKCSFDRIAERLPDSIGYFLTYNIESGKKIYLDKKVLSSRYRMVTANFDVDAILDMKMNLEWSVVDTVNISFTRKIASFPMSSKSIDLMKNKEMELYATVGNNSNIIGRLSAVIDNDSENASGVKGTGVQLLGTDGILLPQRGKTSENHIIFNQDEIREISGPESLDVKWNLELYPNEVDALSDSDYVDIDAEIILKGEQTTESMFSD